MLLRWYYNNWRSNDVLLRAILGTSVIRGKTEGHLMNRTQEEDNTMMIQKRDEEKFSGLT